MIPTNPVEYLKEHITCKFSIAVDGKHKRKWSKGAVLQNSDINNFEINCCQELLTEITLESDYKDKEQYKNLENQEYAENLLQKAKAGYYVSSHKGKSNYVRFRFRTSQEITPQLRLAIIRYFAKPDLHFDENFFSINYVRPVPNRYHWKHSYEIEKVIKVHEGEDLDIDSLGIKAHTKPIGIIRSGSLPQTKIEYEPQGWALSISISKMARRYGFINCPQCNNAFSFRDSHGFFYCKSCKYGGSIKKFAEFIQTKLYGWPSSYNEPYICKCKKPAVLTIGLMDYCENCYKVKGGEKWLS